MNFEELALLGFFALLLWALWPKGGEGSQASAREADVPYRTPSL